MVEEEAVELIKKSKKKREKKRQKERERVTLVDVRICVGGMRRWLRRRRELIKIMKERK